MSQRVGDDAEDLTIFEEDLEERRYSKVHDSDRCENKQGDQGKCYNASTTGEKVLYDDEPRNIKELLAHPEREEIQKDGDDEFQQLIDQQVGMIVPKSEARVSIKLFFGF